MSAAFQTVALIGKYKSPGISAPLLELARFLEQRGAKVLVDRLTASHLGSHAYPVHTLEEIGVRADLAIVLGGDGTMLNIARTLGPHDVALVGVNMGRLGFLTDVGTDAMLETIGEILDGRYAAEHRMLLAGEVVSGGRAVHSGLAFNDVVLHRGMSGSMIEFEVRIDGQFVYTQRSDGLIVATPTGSTAYALSAGGPILHPGLDVMSLVPICPHTLSNRPIVVASGSTVEILMHGHSDASRAHFDSHSHCDLRNNDKVVVRRAPHTIRLLHPVGHSYYHMLREKLHWSEHPGN
ncbi:MAG TPA: NAD kinase [Burkholderiales bacterium]|nr:NAD kinase [Burkholderiales bacterium]